MTKKQEVRCQQGNYPSMFGEPLTADKPLPLQSVQFEVEPGDAVVRITAISKFINNYNEPVDVVWTQPRHPQMAVTKVAVMMGGIELKGQLSAVEDAQKIFKDATTGGEAALLAETPSSGRLRLALGNLAAGAEAEVKLEFICSWLPEGGDAVVRLPLTMGQRYREILHAPLTADSVYTTTVRIKSSVEPRSNVTLRAKSGHFETLSGWVPEGDFVLYRESIDKPMAIWSNFQGTTASGDSGTVSVLLPPKAVDAVIGNVASPVSAPRNVIVLLDVSGSMGSWKLAEAVRATSTIVSSLKPEDCFDVATFDNNITWSFGEMVAADSPNIAWVSNELQLLVAGGGTDMDAALMAADERFSKLEDDHEQLLIIVTDAQFGNPQALANCISENVRVCAVGVDAAVNEEALSVLCSADGSYEVVGAAGEIRWAAQRIVSLVAEPLVHASNLEEATWSEFVPLVNGRLVIAGAQFDSRPEKVRFSGFDVSGGEVSFEIDVSDGLAVDTQTSATVALAQLDYLASEASRETTKKTRTDLALAAGVLSDVTSWVLRSGDTVVGEVSGAVIRQPHMVTRSGAKLRRVGGNPGASLHAAQEISVQPSLGLRHRGGSASSGYRVPLEMSQETTGDVPVAASRNQRKVSNNENWSIIEQLEAAIESGMLRDLRSALARVVADSDTAKKWVRKISAALARVDISDEGLVELAKEWLIESKRKAS